MKVAVLGAGGLLGRHLVEELTRAGHAVTSLDRARCDLTNLEQVLDATSGAAVIYNCAAYTNVDGAEADEATAVRVNGLGAEHVARAAEAHGAGALHVSTDFVFDGRQARPYDEAVVPAPLSAYGRSKRDGEERFLRVTRRGWVVRVQGLYGVGGRNFASRLPVLLAQGAPLVLDDERVVQPTFVRVTARTLVAIATGAAPGTYHVSCAGQTTWAQFAGAMAEQLGLRPAFRAARTRELSAPAARPAYCVLAHGRLLAAGLPAPPPWQTGLAEFLSESVGRASDQP